MPHHHHPDAPRDDATQIARLIAENERQLPELRTIAAHLHELARAGGLDVRRILDMGCGAGVATVVLADEFADAVVVAADVNPAMLAATADRAARFDRAARVVTEVADLDADVTALGPVQVAWASLMLHHVSDEQEAMRHLRGVLAPGGLLALIEFDEEARRNVRGMLDVDTPDASYRALIESNGFVVVDEHAFEVPPPDAPTHDDAEDGANGHGHAPTPTRCVYVARAVEGWQP